MVNDVLKFAIWWRPRQQTHHCGGRRVSGGFGLVVAVGLVAESQVRRRTTDTLTTNVVPSR